MNSVSDPTLRKLNKKKSMIPRAKTLTKGEKRQTQNYKQYPKLMSSLTTRDVDQVLPLHRNNRNIFTVWNRTRWYANNRRVKEHLLMDLKVIKARKRPRQIGKRLKDQVLIWNSKKSIKMLLSKNQEKIWDKKYWKNSSSKSNNLRYLSRQSIYTNHVIQRRHKVAQTNLLTV